MSTSTSSSPQLPSAPPGLEHVDIAANLKAFANLQLDAEKLNNNITISVVPPTAGLGLTFDDEQHAENGLLHTNGKYVPPRPVGHDKNQGVSSGGIPSTHDIEECDPIFFLPSWILDGNEEDETWLLRKLDLAEAAAEKRPCKAVNCLKRRAFELTASLPQDHENHFHTKAFFSPVSTTRIYSTSSDTSSESGLESLSISTTNLDTASSRSPSPDSIQSSNSTSTSSHTGGRPTGRRQSEDSVYFHASGVKGVLLPDVLALKPDSMLLPEEEVLMSWGTRGRPACIRLVVNQHGYHKQTFFIPTRCFCSNITRAKLAYDIACVLESYFKVCLVSGLTPFDPLIMITSRMELSETASQKIPNVGRTCRGSTCIRCGETFGMRRWHGESLSLILACRGLGSGRRDDRAFTGNYRGQHL
ncbi:hypothetical protein FPV67DRAFT_875398 [Lyophyllum atratum]|nr:hypothetical protein FPV67DRAFT_875398 [Lyophyllum atratum]